LCNAPPAAVRSSTASLIGADRTDPTFDRTALTNLLTVLGPAAGPLGVRKDGASWVPVTIFAQTILTPRTTENRMDRAQQSSARTADEETISI
jgi:hypothetical protein